MPGEQRIFCGGCAVGAGHVRPAAFPQARFYLSVAGRACPAPTTLWIFREGHPYGRPGADLTLQVDARIVQKCDVLDDRKAQTGAAGRLGAALVHAVEPLKHAGLAVLRDADAVVLDLKVGAAVTAYAAAQLYMAARAVVAYGVVAQVLGQLAQLVAAACTVAGRASYCSVT